jgi:hypothetical protein
MIEKKGNKVITYKEMDVVLNDYLEECKARAKAQGKDSGLAYAAALGGMQFFITDLILSSKDEKASRQTLASIIRATEQLKGGV